MRQNKQRENRKNICIGVWMAFLFFYTFRNINQGIDVTDTGYHFSNFLYMEQMDPMWIFSTYLASLLGHFFTLLPGGQTLLGLNAYTALLPALTGVLSFWFFVKMLHAPVLLAALGELIALSLCWCPTTCVYNYLTYLFFTVGVLFLYLGLSRRRYSALFFAGIFLGVNVLVRFPNLAEAAMILAVWYTCLIRREKIGEYVKETGICLLGYVTGLAFLFLQIALQYGLKEYVEGIIRLLSMTNDASDYTLYAMVVSLLQAYLFSGKWMVIILLCVLLGVLGFAVLPGRFVRIKSIGYALCCAVLIRWFYGQGMFSLSYDGYGSILNWGVLAVIAALLLAAYFILRPQEEEACKILSVIMIGVIGITPLGSNNQLYANINNLFLVMPFVLYGCYRIFQRRALFQRPLLIMTAACVLMLTWQSLCFGNTFSFRDGIPRNSQVTSLASLKGMKTNEENAKALEALGQYVKDAGLQGRDVLLFGDVPALSAYLEMPFVMSPWPDLTSYSNQTFEKELSAMLSEMDKEKKTVLIFGREFYDFITNSLEDEEVYDSFTAKYGFKADLLCDMIMQYQYVCTFENDAYVILE